MPNRVGFNRARALQIGRLLALLLLGAFVIQQALLLSESVSTGVVRSTYSTPLYGYMQAPSDLARQADSKLGADYMCLYFAATNYLENDRMYDLDADPWNRPAVTFPPHLIYLTAYSLQRVDFPISVLLNGFFQIGLFLVAAFLYTRRSTSTRDLWVGLLLIGFLIFCTPIGTTWFERSQTDLYAGIAFVFFLKAIRDNSSTDFILGGLFASLKWSSLPFLASTALVYLWFGRESRSRKVALVGTTLGIAFVLPLLLGQYSAEYIRLVASFETSSVPRGISLVKYLPMPLAKISLFVLPSMMIALHRIWKRANWNVRSTIEVVFWSANAFICAGYGTVAFEYRLISLLFLVPLLVSGRSILFPDSSEPLSPFSRLCGLMILLYTFRIETHLGIVDSLLGYSRILVALLGSNLLLVVVSLWVSRRR